jgi:hypothetical protein
VWLVAEVVPGEGLGVQAAAREEMGDGVEGGALGPSGAGSEASEVDGDRVAVGVGDRGREEVLEGGPGAGLGSLSPGPLSSCQSLENDHSHKYRLCGATFARLWPPHFVVLVPQCVLHD